MYESYWWKTGSFNDIQIITMKNNLFGDLHNDKITSLFIVYELFWWKKNVFWWCPNYVHKYFNILFTKMQYQI